MMNVVSIVGARPQFIKVAPIARAIAAGALGANVRHQIIHTGQHYDAQMSDIFFAELELPQAAVNLGVGSGSHGSQTGTMLAELERVLMASKPDAIIVYGDTNSTLAASLAGVKLHIPVAHVEAGLRSFNRHMPEEINRVAADHVCDLLFAPTPVAVANLRVEGLAGRSVYTGDVMYDSVLFFRKLAAKRSTILTRLGLHAGTYAVATLHRAENTDHLGRLGALLASLNLIADQHMQVIFPIHPRTLARIKSALPNWQPHERLRVIEPVGYLDMLTLVGHGAVTLTDSGGLQKEAFFLGCPCVTLRDETEWEETVRASGNVLTGADPAAIAAAVAGWLERYPHGQADFTAAIRSNFGDGQAAIAICAALRSFLQSDDQSEAIESPASMANSSFDRVA